MRNLSRSAKCETKSTCLQRFALLLSPTPIVDARFSSEKISRASASVLTVLGGSTLLLTAVVLRHQGFDEYIAPAVYRWENAGGINGGLYA